VKITVGEGNFKFFPVDLQGIKEELNHFLGIVEQRTSDEMGPCYGTESELVYRLYHMDSVCVCVCVSTLETRLPTREAP
jgi:hypothetical protein